VLLGSYHQIYKIHLEIINLSILSVTHMFLDLSNWDSMQIIVTVSRNSGVHYTHQAVGRHKM